MYRCNICYKGLTSVEYMRNIASNRIALNKLRCKKHNENYLKNKPKEKKIKQEPKIEERKYCDACAGWGWGSIPPCQYNH